MLYVVDSVTRQWVEKARQAGQVPPGSAAADGTFASGVQKMTELLPVMMNELIQTAPENQKVRFYVALPSDQLHIPLQLGFLLSTR